MKLKIAVITGTRADYGIYTSLLEKLQQAKNYNLYLFVTGMHLMKEFGYTYNVIKKDGFPVYARVNAPCADDTGEAMGIALAKAVQGFTRSLSELTPDLVFVLGDRSEMLAAASAANYIQIPVAHIHGGEISGHVDGTIRHAITKLSHLHFPATRTSASRIRKMGEEPWRITTSGAPALDRILSSDYTSSEDLIQKYGLSETPPILAVYHPVSGSEKEAPVHAEAVIRSVCSFKQPVIVIYPNSDAGGRAIIKRVQSLSNKLDFTVFQSLPHQDYLGLLRYASVLVGNSSSGIIEAASFRLPVVNVGDRQQGRERGINVIDTGVSQKHIRAGLKKALSPAFRKSIARCRNPYGTGKAAEKIISVLNKLSWNADLFDKNMTY